MCLSQTVCCHSLNNKGRAFLISGSVSGGWGAELQQLIEAATTVRDNKLAASEYDETMWAARNYRTFVKQRISVAIHMAAAQEIQHALGLSAAVDPRGEVW